MKLATLMDGSRDGQLAVVSRDLTLAHFASGIAQKLQQVLDDWNFISPQLEDLSATLNGGKARHAFAFDAARCLAPLPRPVAWLRANADAIEAAAGGALGGARLLLAPDGDEPPFVLMPQVAALTGDVPRGADADTALEGVRLLLLGAEAVQGATRPQALRLHTHAVAGFGPVAVTPDELGEAWRRGRLQGWFQVHRRGGGAAATVRRVDAESLPRLGERVAVASRQRPLAAGTLVALDLPMAAQAEGGQAESAAMDLCLAAGDDIRFRFESALDASPLGELSLRVGPVGEPRMAA